MSRKHVLLHALEILALIVVIVGVAAGFQVHARSDESIQGAAQRAAIQAANTPNPACNPARGSGYMGVCAPAQAFAVADQLGVAAGDPNTVTTPLGVDVSDNQGCQINWASEAAAGVKFAYLKATESTTDTDACLAHNLAGVKAAHLPYGAYDFLRPGESTPAAEAAHFAAVVKADDADTSLPPVADVEVSDGESPAQVRAYVTAWNADVAHDLSRTPFDYTDPGFWNAYVGATTAGAAGLWDAAWAPSPILPAGWGAWRFWQFTDGVVGPSPRFGSWDVDTFNGTLSQLDALAGIKPAPKPPAKTVTSTTSTATTATPKPKPKPAVCFAEDGRDLKPITTACRAIDHRHAFDAGRREHWHKVMVRTRDHSSTTYKHALHWYRVRRGEAHKLWLEHSA